MVRKCVRWALIDRVGSVVDYKSRVWNNAFYPTLFKKYSTKKKSSRFSGLMWATPASYDKLVSNCCTCIFYDILISNIVLTLVLIIQGHYSIVLHIYIDLHVNLLNLTVGDTLDYISFFAFQCNGTSVLAEIHRVIMSDLPLYRDKVLLFGDSFFEFLYDMAKQLFPNVKGVGSCTDPRCTYSGGSNKTNWTDKQDLLLELCRSFYTDPNTIKTKAAMREKCTWVINELKNGKDPETKKLLYCGVGTMGAIHFVQISAALGLIPLHCMTFAELIDNNLGPPRFLRLALQKGKEFKIEDCNGYFKELHKDIVKIWGILITMALLENLLCELSRCYKASSARMKRIEPTNTYHGADIITDKNLMVDGKTNDVAFYDEKRQCIQSSFNLRMQGGDGASELRPVLVMRLGSKWNESQDVSLINLGNWMCDKNDSKHMSWVVSGNSRTLSTGLIVSQRVEKEMLLMEDE